MFDLKPCSVSQPEEQRENDDYDHDDGKSHGHAGQPSIPLGTFLSFRVSDPVRHSHLLGGVFNKRTRGSAEN